MGILNIIIIIGIILGMRCGGSKCDVIRSNFERLSGELFTSLHGCNLVKNGCIYNAYCNNNFNIDYESTLVNDNNCNNVIFKRGNYFLPINVVWKGYNLTPFTKNERYESDYYDDNIEYRSPNVFVQSVNFSGNGYFDMPDITDLINLKTLNMSHNMLTIAILSNSNQLDYLQEIDFSFNSIETIDVPVDTNPYRELKVIDLSHNSLTVIPEEILYHFVKLEKIDVSHNLITNINNMVFFGLKQILVLDLSYNQIVSVGQSLAKLHMLRELYLQENKLFDIQYNALNSLKLLTTVDFSYNNIENIENGVFNNMTQLSLVNLKNNNLHTVEANMFVNSNKLEFIDLSQNKIQRLPLYMFKHKNILHFSIAENDIEGNLEKGMFEGLKNVQNLDLSYQKIAGIYDATFLGVESINEILLNNNKISKLEKDSLKFLTKLIRLDLSHNFISNFTVNTEDLLCLEYLSLCNNKITHIEKSQFKLLNKLEFLDVSGNKIINVEPNSFIHQPYLKILIISNNHLQGSLSQGTFNGLQALPELDLSYSFLTGINNGSFEEMRQLNSLNISHCSIRDISYNAFVDTGNLDTLDLSHNQLTLLNINTTDMTKLKTLILHNNFINNLQENLFNKTTQLKILDLSYNSLVYLSDNIFSGLSDLEFLNVSNNFNLIAQFEILIPLKKLKSLTLSGCKVNISVDWQQDSLLELKMSNTSLSKLSNFKLGNIIDLSNLVLSHNEITDLGNDIANMSSLHSVDLSYNKIRSLQPGSFFGCNNLNLLNISHNLIKNINYGAFHGLIQLNVLDMSYNLLENLEDEKFYQMHFLQKIIVDYNKISYVSVEEFLGTRLQILSIGGNPLPCKALIKLKRDGNRFQITAIALNKSGDHNYYGVACVDSNEDVIDYKKENNFQSDGDVKILMDIRNVIKELNTNMVKHDDLVSLSNVLLNNVRNISPREELNNMIMILRNLTNITIEKDERNNKINIQINEETKKTNSLLDRVLKVIVAKNNVVTPLPFEITSNSTQYLKYIKDLENNFIMEKERIVAEFDDKILKLSKKIEVKTDNSNSTNFTEVCVAIILLLILVCCVAYYMYKTQIFIGGRRHTRSMSTRQITVDMDNSNL